MNTSVPLRAPNITSANVRIVNYLTFGTWLVRRTAKMLLAAATMLALIAAVAGAPFEPSSSARTLFSSFSSTSTTFVLSSSSSRSLYTSPRLGLTADIRQHDGLTTLIGSQPTQYNANLQDL